MTDTRGKRWMLYGAYGYTGKLIIDEALARGLRPVLAGRDGTKLRELADAHGLDWCAVGLDDAPGLDAALADIELVYHVAGPFTQTARPMREACLRTRTHYIDVTGESPVTRDTLAEHERALAAGIVLLPSSGVNTVPTDAAAAYVHRLLPDANWLEVAIDTVHQRSSGSLVSMLEVASLAGQVRRGGKLVDEAIGSRRRRVRFPEGNKHCVALPFADLYTAWEATRIPDITAYVVQDYLAIRAMQFSAPLMSRAFSGETLRKRVQDEIRRRVAGPDATTRNADSTWTWALARNPAGEQREVWLETLEGYSFTAAVAPPLVEAVLGSRLRGATTVTAAFGADFVLRLPRTRFLTLPGR
jgi:short subunit dehydrogenase-like uncharacterized protein